MKQRVREQFLAKFYHEPLLVQAPGRFNLIGEHTDYNEGWVLPGAIGQSIWLALGRSDRPDVCDFTAIDVGEQAVFRLGEPVKITGTNWQDYVQATFTELQQRGYPVRGVEGVFGGNIPLGAGLSSSAALCCGLIFGIASLQNFRIKRREIALIAQAAEHRVGLHCGLMDQYAVLFGEVDRMLLLDCKTLDFRHLDLTSDHHSLVLINSKIKHELAAGGGYNERRASCERVVAAVRSEHGQVRSLRDVSPALLASFRPQLSEVDFRRAAYVLAENERVLRMVAALRANNFSEAGRLLFEAHEGMRTQYEITVPEIDLLVDLAKKEAAVLGARMVGGGFGGCTLNLVETAEKVEVSERIAAAYQQQTGIQPDIIEVGVGDGVRLV
ncbi:MAG: galactokinase [Bacteroidetes bacterium]|nr:galactokinase [Bacteroidota bacterium]